MRQLFVVVFVKGYVVVVVVAFSSLARILGVRFDDSFPACVSFFFFKVEISSRTSFPLFSCCQEQSTVAQRAETTVAECFPDELRVSSFSFIGSNTVPGQHSQPTQTSLGQGCMHV